MRDWWARHVKENRRNIGAMTRWSTATVVRLAMALLIAFSVRAGVAQRGGGHGGFAAHGASHVSGGFRASAPRPAIRPSFTPSRPGMTARGFAPRRQFMPAGRMDRSRVPYRSGFDSRPPQYRPDRYRHPYRGGYRSPYVNTIATVWPGWSYPYYLGYPDDYGYDYGDDQTTQAQPDQEDTYAGAPYSSEPGPWPAYPPPEPAAPQTAPALQDSVTLIFKDGRPQEQIRNYMMTGNTLYVLDQKRREIPLKDLDLAATARANQDAGVDFNLPTGTP